MVPLRATIQLSPRAIHPFPFPSVLTHSFDRRRRPTAAVLLLLAPHPSILHVLLNYHYLTLRAPLYFIAHLLVIYAFSFLAFSSLIACVARDPGPVPDPRSEDVGGGGGGGGAGSGADEISIEDALLSTAPSDDYAQPGKWCRICWRPKPERAHHCSQCGRCVLKMGVCPLCCQMHRTHSTTFHTLDHHCPWMGAKCIVRRRLPLLNIKRTSPPPLYPTHGVITHLCAGG